MTREKAIQVLHHIVQVADTSDCGIKEIDGIDEKALDMAIKALEQEPVLDKIRAEIETWHKEGTKTIQEKQAESEKYQKAFDDGYENGYAQARFDYEQEPCGDAISRQKMHWIANAPQYDMLNPQYICSECGNAHTRTTPYCEMCGARMESEDKERHLKLK